MAFSCILLFSSPTMPLNFEEPETKQEKSEEDAKRKSSRSPFGRKKEKAVVAPKKNTVGGKASSSHRRVFTKSSQYFATFTVKVIKATDLPGKKSIQPYCQIYLGRFVLMLIFSLNLTPFVISTSFATKPKKKTNNPEWNEEFSTPVDRDDNFSIKVWDMGKLERNVDIAKKIPPLCKKKIPLKDFARKGNLDHDVRTISMVGGGSLEVEITFTINIPVPGQIHTKTFSYPSWMSDRYGVNQVEPDMDSINTGITTIARYTSRWLLNQRAIQASLQKDDDEDEEEENQDIPDGLMFELIDISCCAHDKALELVVCYSWNQKEEQKDDDDDDLFTRPSILTSKLFSVATKIPKKKLYEHKGMAAKSYQELFNKVRSGTEEVLQNGKFHYM